MYWSQIPLSLAFYFSKAALLARYLRLFPHFMRKRRSILWAVIAYSAAAYVVTLLTTIFICRPIEGNWLVIPLSLCDDGKVVAGRISDANQVLGSRDHL